MSVAGVVVVVGILAAAFLLFAGYGRTDGGHVAVIRNGGPLDNTKIRQVVPAGSGRVRIGLYSSQHNYPTSQRFFTISVSGKGDANESVTVPTADGVNVGIEGSAYFTVNTDPANGWAVLKDFDNKYGTRKFSCGGKASLAVWDGDAGFSCFLDQIVAPVINNDLRVLVGSIRCADLVASCALVQNAGRADPSKVGAGNSSLAQIEAGISSSLGDDLTRTLGGDYLRGVKFNLAKVDLDPKVQDAISTAQAAFAQVSQAQARVQQAAQDALANQRRQAGYNACPACQQIDILKALPQGITVFAPGSGSGVSLSVPAGK